LTELHARQVAVGRILKPHGVRGELVVEVRTDEPEQRFAVGASLGVRFSAAGGPAVSTAGGPAVSTAGGPAVSTAGGPAVSTAGGPAVSAAGGPALLTVQAARRHGERLVVRFEGIADRSDAESLRGAVLIVDRSALPPTADPEEFYDHQLVGLTVVLVNGGLVGVVADVLHGPGGDLLVVAREGAGDALVPFVHQIVPTVDLAAGRIVVDPPEGLLA